jgi:hypothetical protein
MKNKQLVIPANLLALTTALQRLPCVTVVRVVGLPAAQPDDAAWMVVVDIPTHDVGRAVVSFLRTMVSRCEWRARSIRFNRLVHPLSGMERNELLGTGANPDPDQLARLILENASTFHGQQPEPTPPFLALSSATNRVNAARNAVGGLRLTFDAPEHETEVSRAYNLICRAEGILEALRTQVPYRGDGREDDPPDIAA